jgi:hypothetical protein
VQVRKDETQHEQFEARVSDASSSLAEKLGVEPLLADKLFRAGGATAELVVQMPLDYIAMAMEVDETVAQEVLDKAHEATGTAPGGASAEGGAAVEEEIPEAGDDAPDAEESAVPEAGDDTPDAEESALPEAGDDAPEAGESAAPEPESAVAEDEKATGGDVQEEKAASAGE